MSDDTQVVHQMKLAEAWDKYLECGDASARDFIVLSYMPFVKKLAHRVMKKKPQSFDYQDIVQAGVIGLLNAVEKYDPSKGASFSTFSQRRVLGAMYDEINRLDWTPRSIRERIKLVIKALEVHREESHVPATPVEVVRICRERFGKDVSKDDVLLALDQLNKTFVHAIDTGATIAQEESRVGFDILSPAHTSVEDTVVAAEFTDLVSRVINTRLNDFERTVFIGVFVDSLTMKSIAEDMGVPVSRVSAAKHRAIRVVGEVLTRQGFNPNAERSL